ncbi:hypothetical protein [Hydrogenophaga taeniospiralis]|uniref:hypothetical protein n=1 Tax=Hydrogenophaga taeniospiralis TaxID=65656 RepID=UPI001CFC3D3E|nr:hypothetical protein [Hydrogenophaga taeniospiralis]UCU94754.1 hypothetical protein KI616_02410 [Hydrogenophaga taeniospiralis]
MSQMTDMAYLIGGNLASIAPCSDLQDLPKRHHQVVLQSSQRGWSGMKVATLTSKTSEETTEHGPSDIELSQR